MKNGGLIPLRPFADDGNGVSASDAGYVCTGASFDTFVDFEHLCLGSIFILQSMKEQIDIRSIC